jgi:cell division protein FtsW
MALCFIPILFVLLEPNNGTVGVMGLTLAIVSLLAKVPYKFWAIPLLVSTVLGVVFAINLPYVSERLKVYLHPELDIQGKGHQPHQAKIAAGSGRLLGKGPGNGWQKLSYLPEAQNDYIAAIFAEEFGFLGIFFLLICYMLFIFAGYCIAMKAQDPLGAQIAQTLTFLIGIQAFLNMGVVSGLLPTSGLNLPFFSQGGTSLIANILAIAILASVASRKRLGARENDLAIV